MNNGNKRRGRRRYRVRYDRIAAVLAVFVVMILLIVSMTQSCSKKKDGKNEASKNPITSDFITNPPETVTDALGQTVTDASGNSVTQPAATQPIQADPSQFVTQSVEYTQVNNGDLVLVNTLYPYKFQEGDTNIVTLYNNRNDYYGTSDNVISLDMNTISQINAMMSDYFAATGNMDFHVIGGYRDINTQNDKYNNGKSRFQGGYSDYHTGRSFDVGIFPKGQSSNYYKEEGIYAWLGQNAANYGFILRYPQGKEAVTGEDGRTYTFRYVGVPHAVYMKANNLCLEEYIEQIKQYTTNNPLQVSGGGHDYQVYYVAAVPNSVTDVPVPSSAPFSISGNNTDGFIVTVTLS